MVLKRVTQQIRRKTPVNQWVRVNLFESVRHGPLALPPEVLEAAAQDAASQRMMASAPATVRCILHPLHASKRSTIRTVPGNSSSAIGKIHAAAPTATRRTRVSTASKSKRSRAFPIRHSTSAVMLAANAAAMSRNLSNPRSGSLVSTTSSGRIRTEQRRPSTGAGSCRGFPASVPGGMRILPRAGSFALSACRRRACPFPYPSVSSRPFVRGNRLRKHSKLGHKRVQATPNAIDQTLSCNLNGTSTLMTVEQLLSCTGWNAAPLQARQQDSEDGMAADALTVNDTGYRWPE